MAHEVLSKLSQSTHLQHVILLNDGQSDENNMKALQTYLRVKHTIDAGQGEKIAKKLKDLFEEKNDYKALERRFSSEQ